MPHPTPARDAAARWFSRTRETAYRIELRGKPLTEREHEILSLVARGRTNAEIGGELGITEQTTKNHMSNILAKLNVEDRTGAAVKYALGTAGAVEHATALIDATERLLLIVRGDIDEALEFVRQARRDAEGQPERRH